MNKRSTRKSSSNNKRGSCGNGRRGSCGGNRRCDGSGGGVGNSGTTRQPSKKTKTK